MAQDESAVSARRSTVSVRSRFGGAGNAKSSGSSPSGATRAEDIEGTEGGAASGGNRKPWVLFT